MTQARSGLIAVALFCAAWCIVPARAQELSEQDFLAEFPTVISASRLRQDVTETPQAITVIDQATIKASGAREIAELFRMVPGFTVSYVTYVKGMQPLVNYHGLGREFFSRLQVLLDGRSMNNPTLGGVDWSEFPLALDDIDRIEIIRGPSSATHGIGAFLATINFVSKHASQERGAGASATLGSGGIRDASARYGGGSGALDYRLTAGHREDDGFDGLHDSRRRTFANARADWQIDSHDTLMAQAGATDGDDGVTPGGPRDPQRTAQVRTWYAQLMWERSVDADNGFHVQMYLNQYDLDDEFLRAPVVPGGATTELDGGSTVQRADLEFQHNFSTGPSLRWVWGASVREDRAEVPSLFDDDRRSQIERLFAHVEWRASERLLVNAGAMLEHNDLTGTDLAPQLALNYRVAPNQALRFNLSRALRTPTLIENQGKFAVGPPGTPREGPPGSLDPESIFSRELSYFAEFPARHLTLDFKLFDDSVHDLIGLVGVRPTLPATPFPRNAVNGDDARQRGLEGQLTWQPSPATTLNLTASHLLTSSDDQLDHYSSSAPRNTFHALVSHRFGAHWDSSLAIHQQDAFRAAGLSDPQRSFCRVDGRVAREFTFATGGAAELAFAVENLFDEDYTEYRRNNVAQRRAWVTFSFRSQP
jgi:iron complex outermembrane receptor protein